MSCNIYYYSGAYSPKLKRELNCDQLFSFYHEQKLTVETIQYKKEHPEYTAKIMLDSGAFTHYQNSKKKGIILTDKDIYDYTDTYIEYLNEHGENIDCFVGVDSVPDPENVDQSFAQKTWENYLYMWERLKPSIRHKLIPVFHYGEDWKWMKKYLEHVHPDGSRVEYLGLAISLEGTRKVRINWGQEAMSIIRASSNPNIKTHAFGVGVKSVLEHIDVYSTDATSWVKRAAYGMISIDDKTIYVSDIQKEKFNGNHYSERSEAYQDAVEETIRSRGFRVDPVFTDYTVTGVGIAKFNVEGDEYVVKLDSDLKLLLIKGDDVKTFKLVTIPEPAPEDADKFCGNWEYEEETLQFDGNGKVTYDDGTVLSTNCYARARFNIIDTETWMAPIRAAAKTEIKTKIELW